MIKHCHNCLLYHCPKLYQCGVGLLFIVDLLLYTEWPIRQLTKINLFITTSVKWTLYILSCWTYYIIFIKYTLHIVSTRRKHHSTKQIKQICFESVSYTHLDVYKRQHIYSSHNPALRRFKSLSLSLSHTLWYNLFIFWAHLNLK